MTPKDERIAKLREALRAMVDEFSDPLADPPGHYPAVYIEPLNAAQQLESDARKLRQQSTAWRNAKVLLDGRNTEWMFDDGP